MEEQRKNIPMERVKIDPMIAEFYQEIGQMQAYRFVEKLTGFKKAVLLKKLHDTKAYRNIPGCETMEKLCEKFGISRQTEHRQRKALETFGEEIVGIMYDSGITAKEQYLLTEFGDIEDAEFEVIDQGEGKIRFDGKILSMQDDPEAVSAAIRKALAALRLQKQANQGLETEAQKSKKKIESLEKKIETGEQQLERLRHKSEPIKHPRITPFSIGLFEVQQLVKQVCAIPLTEEDEKHREYLLQRAANTISVPLTAKLNPRGEDLSGWAESAEAENEFEQVNDGVSDI